MVGKEKGAEPMRCINCGAELSPPRRSYCSEECRHQFRIVELQENVMLGHYDWRLLWPRMRSEVLKRDNYTCQACGARGIISDDLEVHHIVPVSKGGECLDPENLITLCKKCHRKTFRIGYGIFRGQLSLKDFMVIRHEMTGASDRPRAVTEAK